MSLHDMPDPEPVIGEIARVLRPANPLAMAIVHPLNRLDEDLDRYFETLRFHDAVTRHGLTVTFDGVDRPLSDYTAALTRNGFVIDRLTEPRPSAEDCRGLADESLPATLLPPYPLPSAPVIDFCSVAPAAVSVRVLLLARSGRHAKHRRFVSRGRLRDKRSRA